MNTRYTAEKCRLEEIIRKYVESDVFNAGDCEAATKAFAQYEKFLNARKSKKNNIQES